MTEQPEPTDTAQSADAGPVSGIAAGVAESDAQGETEGPADLQSGAEGRTDPDDPRAAIQEATQQSRGGGSPGGSSDQG